MNSRQKSLFSLTGLLLANLAVLILSVYQEIATGFPHMTIEWGLVPSRLTEALLSGSLPEVGHNILTFLTSTFLHGGFDHFFNNMALLLIMGILVEREFGSARFLAIYLLSGLAGSLGHYLFHAFDYRPMIGASGAVAGVMAAFVIAVFCLGQRLTMLRILGVLFVGDWMLDQVASVYVNSGAHDGVAYFAHLGGFAGGLAISILFAKLLAKHKARVRPPVDATDAGMPHWKRDSRKQDSESAMRKPDADSPGGAD